MSGRRAAPIAAGLLLATLVAAFVGLELWRDAAYGEPSAGESVLYIRSGETVKRLSLSNAALLADLYWVRAVQYYGGNRLSKLPNRRYDLLYPLLDITTSLDPQFNIAYRFGAIFLAESYPGGAGRPDLAIALLEKGSRSNPTRWQYLQDIGFVHYWWRNDFLAAAAWFRKAGDVPGAPWWLRSLAAVTLAQGGDRRSSRLLWQSLGDTGGDAWLRRNAAFRLAQLDALDAIDRLSALVRAHEARTGRWPSGWEVLVREGVIGGIPPDPTGVPYALDGDTGAVTLSPSSSLNPLPTGARAALPAH